jgi:hypothetical protein
MSIRIANQSDMIQAAVDDFRLHWLGTLQDFIRVGSVETVRAIRALEAESTRIWRRKRRSAESVNRATRYQERALQIRNWLPEIIEAEQRGKCFEAFRNHMIRMQFRRKNAQSIETVS